MRATPIWVYDNWAAYTDGFAGLDDTRLTEEFALRQLRNVARARRLGVRVDYYLMNAFWYEPDGGYRQWRKQDWPDGPDRWIDGCYELGVKPGLWFGSNTLWKLVATPEWADSVDPAIGPGKYEINGAMSFSDGGFLPDFLTTLQHWYDRGVRLFEFDTANFAAGSARQHRTLAPEEIRERNIIAFVEALTAFRAANPDIVLAGFNGFGGDIGTTSSPVEFEHPVDPRFVTVFDSLYTGDLRVSDVPHQSFWRSLDVFTDHMVRRFEANGVPLHRADPLGFVMATTWFGANRGATALFGQSVLTAARGSVKKTLYGDLGLLSDDQARWFARLQRLYTPVLENGTTETFGGMPGEIVPYGFVSFGGEGALHVAVNPTQEMREVDLPARGTAAGRRLLFADSGFVPEVTEGGVVLGPGQLALVGSGRYAAEEYDLGVEPDVVIPRVVTPVEAAFEPAGHNVVEATVVPPPGTIRVVCRQFGADGWAHRTVEYVEETAERLGVDASLRGRSFTIEVSQDGRALPVERSGVVAEFYGTSWVVGEVPAGARAVGEPVTIRCSSRDAEPMRLEAEVLVVEYPSGGR